MSGATPAGRRAVRRPLGARAGSLHRRVVMRTGPLVVRARSLRWPTRDCAIVHELQGGPCLAHRRALPERRPPAMVPIRLQHAWRPPACRLERRTTQEMRRCRERTSSLLAGLHEFSIGWSTACPPYRSRRTATCGCASAAAASDAAARRLAHGGLELVDCSTIQGGSSSAAFTMNGTMLLSSPAAPSAPHSARSVPKYALRPSLSSTLVRS